jgi:hypothetical protein
MSLWAAFIAFMLVLLALDLDPRTRPTAGRDLGAVRVIM